MKEEVHETRSESNENYIKYVVNAYKSSFTHTVLTFICHELERMSRRLIGEKLEMELDFNFM